MEEKIIPVDMNEHMRRRPAMYIGGTDEKGIRAMLVNTLVEFMELYKSDSFLFTFQLYVDSIALDFEGAFDPGEVVQILTVDSKGKFNMRALIALSHKFEMYTGDTCIAFMAGKCSGHTELRLGPQNKLRFSFQLDESIFNSVHPDFHELSTELRQFAMLHRGARVLVKEQREVLLSQNYYHYPDGIKKLFEKEMHNKYSGCAGHVFIDTHTKAYSYQLGIGFQRAFWKSDILCFANEKETYQHGSHVEGTLLGIIKALKVYAARHPDMIYKFPLSKIKQAFVLVLAVRGEIEWEGCTRTKVKVPRIKRETSELAYKQVLSYLHEHPGLADKFLAKFYLGRSAQTAPALTHCRMACLVAGKPLPAPVPIPVKLA